MMQRCQQRRRRRRSQQSKQCDKQLQDNPLAKGQGGRTRHSFVLSAALPKSAKKQRLHAGC
jgi:hypothetical protein